MKEVQIGRPPIYIYPDGTQAILEKHKDFQDSKLKRKILVVHRRGRKTSMCLEEVFKYLSVNPKIIGKTLAPIRKQAKEIIWDDPDMLFKIVPKEIIKKIDNGALKIELKNGSIWYLDGADDPDFQRGGNVKVLHLTEAGDHKEEVWSSVYEPILTLNGGVALFEGNPRGENWFYRLYSQAIDRSGWGRWLIPATETPIFTPEQLADIQRSVPENVFIAEYLCGWVGSEGSVFRGFEELSVLEEKEVERGKHYRIGIDLAKLQDFTVLSVIDRTSWDQVKLERFNQLDWTLIKDRIQGTIKQFSLRDNNNQVEVIIESNGVGDPIYDDLVKWSASISKEYNILIRPFKTTNALKNMLVSNFSMLLDKKFIKLINNDKQKEELGSFTYTKNRETFTYSAPQGLHDDIVMADMIAYWNLGSKQTQPDFSEEKIKTLEQRFKEKLAQKKLKNINDLYNSYVL